MKRKYFLPQVEIVTFDVDNVLLVSNGDNFFDWSEFSVTGTGEGL